MFSSSRTNTREASVAAEAYSRSYESFLELRILVQKLLDAGNELPAEADLKRAVAEEGGDEGAVQTSPLQRWLLAGAASVETPTSGMLAARASPLATAMATRRPVKLPGPQSTSNSVGRRPARRAVG
jgi:hypothetical protein